MRNALLESIPNGGCSEILVHRVRHRSQDQLASSLWWTDTDQIRFEYNLISKVLRCFAEELQATNTDLDEVDLCLHLNQDTANPYTEALNKVTLLFTNQP